MSIKKAHGELLKLAAGSANTVAIISEHFPHPRTEQQKEALKRALTAQEAAYDAARAIERIL